MVGLASSASVTRRGPVCRAWRLWRWPGSLSEAEPGAPNLNVSSQEKWAAMTPPIHLLQRAGKWLYSFHFTSHNSLLLSLLPLCCLPEVQQVVVP